MPDRGRRIYLSQISVEIGMVPLAGIEPALLAELDFESSASTNSATGAYLTLAVSAEVGKPAEYSGRFPPVNPWVGVGESRPTRHLAVIRRRLDSADRAG